MTSGGCSMLCRRSVRRSGGHVSSARTSVRCRPHVADAHRAACARSSTSSIPTFAHANQGPASPSCSRRTVSRVRSAFRVVRAPPALDRRRAGGRATRRRSTSGAPPIPMLPSSRSAVPQRPCPGTRSKIERCKHGRAASACDRECGQRDVDAERDDARFGERERVTRRSAADVEDRTVDSFEQAMLGRRHRFEPSVARAPGARDRRPPAGTATVRDVSWLGVRRRALTARALVREAAVRARRPRGRSAYVGRERGDRERVVELVDVAERRERAGPQPERAQPGQLLGMGVIRAHLDTVEHAGVGSAQPDAPPSSVERRPEDGVGVAIGEHRDRGRHEMCVELRRVHADEERRPAQSRERVREALAEAGADLRHDHEVRAGATARGTVERDDVPARGHRRETCRGCRRARLRPSTAASSGVHGGHSRVLTRPGSGDLAMTSNVDAALHRSTRAMSWTARAVPRTVPVTFDLSDPRRVAARRPRRMRQPARDARRTISSGQPNRRSSTPRPEQVESSHRAHRSEVGEIGRACGGEAPRRGSDSRRGRAIGHEPLDARRAPITRSASPASTGAATATRSAPSNEPSQSMKHTTSSVAASRPVQQAAPKPRRGSTTTCAP